ncbi:MAG: aminodeoxychorismate synthase component I [Bacteroidales bacterium]|jgi:para-aminobenzoate synthetase component 1|nr:aminodeoxychorismate synthase component I [Bacteroidales bacterium]
MNALGKKRIPFLFVLDYQLQHPAILPLDHVKPEEIRYSINGVTNVANPEKLAKQLDFNFTPVDFKRYKKAFNLVQQHILHGNSFLLNLTMPSTVVCNYSLKEIFASSHAKYKLWFKDQFVVYSPEIFIQTKGRKISSFPMKGTIDAKLPDAKNILLSSKKEVAEHHTIVDLIRNDLSRVAKKVRVTRFQYIDHIKTNKRELLQMSSEVSGELPADYHEHLGDIIFNLLPAGSISGAPKTKTLEIIQEAEQYDRGYFTGIFGIFDGQNIDSGVMIRFIEKTSTGLIYKSGGGITSQSDCTQEYEELKNKIYVPVA